MNKLQMAHEYAKELAANYGDVMQFSEVLAKSWWLADAMFAEFEKRQDKSRPAVLEDWQPDWSLAPENAVACAMDADKYMWWFTETPRQATESWTSISSCLVRIYKDHGYTGDWRDSLRMRPEGV